MKAILPYIIVLVLTSTIAATKTCCPGENIYDFEARICTEGWSGNMNLNETKNINLQCPGMNIAKIISETELSSEAILDTCHTRVINDPEYNSSLTFYISCFDETILNDSMETQNKLSKIGFLLLAISVIFLILTVAVYVILPELRDLQGICIVHALCGLISAFISLLIVNLGNLSGVGCQLFATTLHFSFTYTFWWLLILSFHIWRTTVKSNSFKKSNWVLIYHIIGTLGPLFCLTALLIVEHHPSEHFKDFRPNFGLSRCWFDGDRQMWMFFYGPLLGILSINFIFYIWTIVYLWKRMRNSQNRALKYRVRLCAKLCIIMGITWIIELITYSYKNQIETLTAYVLFIFIPDIINRLQGVFVFLILVVFRKRVKRLLAQKKFFNRQFFPTAWTNLHDEEMDSDQIKEGQTQYDDTEITPMRTT